MNYNQKCRMIDKRKIINVEEEKINLKKMVNMMGN